ILTGHGAFKTYPNRFFGKSPLCFCGKDEGTVEHTILTCDAWQDIRDTCFKKTAAPLKNFCRTANQEKQLCQLGAHRTTCSEKVLAAVRTLDRFGISDQAGAAIVSATLQDVGIISGSNVLNVVERNKIRRGRTKARTTLLSQVIKDYAHDQFGLYFDELKDRTLSMKDNRRKVIIEEHISLVKEPGSEYIGHVCNKVRFDGTSVNTVVKGGIIRNMELILNHPLQWFVCQLHANELPLRHNFAHVDETTTGPRSFTGEIRKSLAGCEKTCSFIHANRMHAM
ncbi:hypothetical protein AVEN_137095-1, partial [Araneus ventricosus]